MASYSIAGMRAISPFYAAKLRTAGIRTTTRLLERAHSPRLRKQLSEETNIPLNLILDWANIADLTRVSGVALTYAELLAAAGIDTVKELKRRTTKTLELQSLNPAQADRTLDADDVAWIARIVWASQ